MRRLVVIGFLTAVVGCQRGPAGGMPSFPPPEVSIARPVRCLVTDYRFYTGRLRAVEKVDIRARVRGYLEKIHFQEGTEVKKGDLLYEIDPRTFQADLAKAEADVVRLDAMLRLAISEAERASRLRGRGAGSEEEYLQKVAARDSANATLLQAKAEVESKKLELGFTRITAPIDGRIGDTQVTVGNLVGGEMDSTLLATIVRLDPLYLSFEGPERDFLDYQKLRREQGAPAHTEKRLAVQLGLDNEEGYPHEAVIDFQDNQVDPRTGTIRVRAVVPNPDRILAPGLFARVRVPFGNAQPRIVIPEEALATDQRGRYVLAIKGEDEVDYKPVKVGPIAEGFAVIDSGLATDDWVIVNGMVKARPGGKVTPEKIELKPPPSLPPVPAIVAR